MTDVAFGSKNLLNSHLIGVLLISYSVQEQNEKKACKVRHSKKEELKAMAMNIHP